MKKIFVCLMLMLFVITFQSCLPDPEYFIRSYGDRISFKEDTSFVDNIDILLHPTDSKLNVKGLLSTTNSMCGRSNSFVLRLTYHQSIISEQFQIQPDAIEILYQNSLLPFNGIDTMKLVSNDKEFVYDLRFGGDTCRTTSLLGFPFDSLVPKLHIHLDNAIYIDEQNVPIDTIYGYK